MAIDPRRLKPTQLVQLLNSTPLGEVVSERTLYRHRARAGLRIGDAPGTFTSMKVRARAR